MTKLMWLFAAGGLGALARYGLGGLVQWWSGSELPVGTIVVNLVGCLAFGFVWTLADERLIISGETRFIILTGFMGPSRRSRPSRLKPAACCVTRNGGLLWATSWGTMSWEWRACSAAWRSANFSNSIQET